MIFVSPRGLAVLLLLPAVALAQAPVAEPTFSGTVDVRVAEVEVLVTDRAGKPVPGLTMGDFVVLEDGQPVEVTNLSSTSVQPMVLAIFLDETSLGAGSRTAALSGLRRFFASGLKPSDRVLIVRFRGALEIQGEPTGNVEALNASLDRIAAAAPAGFAAAQERSSLQREIIQALPPDQERDLGLAEARAASILANLRMYSEERAETTRAALGALQQTLALLASLPERKALLYIGGGLVLSPGADLFDLWTNKYHIFASRRGVTPMETTRWDASRQVQETADRANAAGVTLHTAALPETGAASASAFGGIARSGWDPEGAGRSLQNLAAATGGRIVTEMQNPAPFLEAAARDLASTYIVGYAPPGGGKKGHHRIKVTARGGELAVRHREERFDGAAGDPLLRRALAALWAGSGENPLKAELTIEEQAREADGRYRVTAIVALPLASVLVKPQEHFHVAHLTLAIAARDGKGQLSGAPRAEFPIEIPNERLLSAPGQTAGYRFTMHLAPGESVVAVALRDDASGAESVARIALMAGEDTAARK
jgi:VWFA-related protein